MWLGGGIARGQRSRLVRAKLSESWQTHAAPGLLERFSCLRDHACLVRSAWIDLGAQAGGVQAVHRYFGSAVVARDDWRLSDSGAPAPPVPLRLHREPGVLAMNVSTNPQAVGQHVVDTEPELGMYDIRVFWIAALIAVLAVLMVAYYKMGY